VCVNFSLVTTALLAFAFVSVVYQQRQTSLGLRPVQPLMRMRSPMTIPRLACRQAASQPLIRQRLQAHSSYKVTLKTPNGDHEIECPSDMYILDKAEMDGIALPYSCRAGFCISCAGLVENGSVDQSDQTFLNVNFNPC